MLSEDILPQDLYTEFEMIKLLIRKGNLNLIHNKIPYQHYISNFINSSTIYISTSLYKKREEKLIHDFILYTRNFLHKMKMKSKYCLMGSINEDKQ